MKMLSLSSVLFAGLFSSTLALANHHDGPGAIAASANELAAASEGLQGYASPAVPPSLVAAAAELHETAERFAVAAATGMVLRNHHDSDPARFADVERAFWNLANEWNADALELSQNRPVLSAYLRVSDDYRHLLDVVYDLDDDVN